MEARRAGGLFHRTRVILLYPRYMFVARTKEPVQVVQVNTSDVTVRAPAAGIARAQHRRSRRCRRQELLPDVPTAMHWTDAQQPQLLQVRMEGTAWSGQLSLDHVGDFVVSLHEPGVRDVTDRRHVRLVRMEVETDARNVVVVTLRDEPTHDPRFRVVNQ